MCVVLCVCVWVRVLCCVVCVSASCVCVCVCVSLLVLACEIVYAPKQFKFKKYWEEEGGHRDIFQRIL
jgi:hypothetical protein